MAIARALPFKIRSIIIMALVVSLFATGLIVIQSAAAAGTPLLAIGTDVTSATLRSGTYRIEVRNEGSGEATNVRVDMNVPDGTTFESSSPAASPVDGSAPGAAPTCDNQGIREPFPTKCQWLLGTVLAGQTVDITVVVNILASKTGAIAVAPRVTGTDPATGSPVSPQANSDATLIRTKTVVTEDTHVGHQEPANTSHAKCPVLTTRGDGSFTAYVDYDPPWPSMEKMWGAEFQVNIAASDYTPQAPGTLTLHAITSGEWKDGPTAAGCAGGTVGEGSDARTGTVPSSKQVPTATAAVTNVGPISWDVLDDLAGASARAAFQGWEIKNTSGSGTADITSIDQSDNSLKPTIVTVHTIAETGRCIDTDPDESIGHPTAERKVTVTIRKAATDAIRIQAAGADACNGTPAAGQLVHWEVDLEANQPIGNTSSPDIYISNQAGTPIPKSGTTDAQPNKIKTTTDDAGRTFIGIRLADPLVWEGDNRVAACWATSTTTSCSVPEPEACSAESKLIGTCTTNGEGINEDDSKLQWSPNASPAPENTSTPAQAPPTISGFSPTAGPVGTSVVIDGSNFNGTSAVRFNGATAAFTVNSPSRITTSVPSGATDGPISVQNAAGTTVSAGNFDVTGSSSSTSPPASNTASPGSGSPNPTVSSAGRSAVNLTLTSSHEESTAFAEVVLSGALGSDKPICAQPGTTIEILKREAETTTFQHLAYVNTGVGGLFEYKVAPGASTIYSASVGTHSTCAAGRSTDVVILVSPEITITSTVSSVQKGRRFWTTGSVLPKHQLTPVTILRKTGPDQWKKVGEDFLDASSRYALALRYKWTKPKSIFITRWKTTDADHISGQSPRLRINRASSLAPVTVHIRSTKSTVAAGGRFRIKGAVEPAHPLSTVTLWKKKGSGKFKKITTAQLDEDSRYSFRLKYRWKRAKSVFVVRWKTSDDDHASGRSAQLIVKRAPRSGAA